MQVSQKGHVEVARVLLEHDAAVDQVMTEIGPHNYATFIMYARQNGHLEVVQALLEHGAAVNQAEYDGTTPLSAVRHGGHPRVVQFLLEHGASE